MRMVDPSLVSTSEEIIYNAKAIIYILGMHESFLAAIDDKCQIKMTQLNTASTLACCCAGMPFFMENIVAKGWVSAVSNLLVIRSVLI